MIASIAKTSEINGTSLQGYVTTTYAKLVKEFGEPHLTHADKTTAEWAFRTSDGIVFTIYDYKEDVTPTREYRWHIGGRDKKAVLAVARVFPNGVEGY